MKSWISDAVLVNDTKVVLQEFGGVSSKSLRMIFDMVKKLVFGVIILSQKMVIKFPLL